MRNLFLIKHHPRRLPEAYQENSRRTRAPRHTLPACAGRYDDESVISLRQRVVNVMPSECRVGLKRGRLLRRIVQRAGDDPNSGMEKAFFPFLATFRRKETGVSLDKSCYEQTRISSRYLRGASAEGDHVYGGPLGVRPPHPADGRRPPAPGGPRPRAPHPHRTRPPRCRGHRAPGRALTPGAARAPGPAAHTRPARRAGRA